MHTKSSTLIFLVLFFSTVYADQPPSATEVLKGLLGPQAPQRTGAVAASDIKVDQQQRAKYVELLDDELCKMSIEIGKKLDSLDQETMERFISYFGIRKIITSKGLKNRELAARTLITLKALEELPQASKMSSPLSKQEIVQKIDAASNLDELLAQLYPHEAQRIEKKLEIMSFQLFECLARHSGKPITIEDDFQEIIQKNPDCQKEQEIIMMLNSIRESRSNKNNDRK